MLVPRRSGGWIPVPRQRRESFQVQELTGNLTCSVARATQGGDSCHGGAVRGESPFAAVRPLVYHRPAVSGPAQTPAAELPDTLGAAEGRLGVSVHITWPDPSPSLKIEVHCIDLDWAEVSQLTRGYLGLQCQSPNSSSMSVCIPRHRIPKASLLSEKSSSGTFRPALRLPSLLPPPE